MPFPWIQVLGRLYVVGSLNNMQPKMPKTPHMSISSQPSPSSQFSSGGPHSLHYVHHFHHQFHPHPHYAINPDQFELYSSPVQLCPIQLVQSIFDSDKTFAICVCICHFVWSQAGLTNHLHSIWSSGCRYAPFLLRGSSGRGCEFARRNLDSR